MLLIRKKKVVNMRTNISGFPGNPPVLTGLGIFFENPNKVADGDGFLSFAPTR